MGWRAAGHTKRSRQKLTVVAEMPFNYKTYSLEEHFANFNQQHWNGNLPGGLLRWTEDPKDMVPGAHAQFDCDKERPHSDWWRIKILIPTATSEDWVNGLLLHEMIHLQFKDDPTERSDDPNFHGEKFKAKAAELAQLTGYDNINDAEVRAEQISSYVHEYMRNLEGR